MNLKVTINLSKLDKSAFFDGKNGKYASFVLWENRDGEDQFGNTHSVKQDLGKERKGERSDYVGNARPIGGQGRDRTAQDAYQKPSQHQQAKGNGYQPQDDEDDSDVPF